MVDTSHPKYTYLKRGVYYFCKAVPVDLIHYYTKDRVVQSLRTKSRTKAEPVNGNRTHGFEVQSLFWLAAALLLGLNWRIDPYGRRQRRDRGCGIFEAFGMVSERLV